MSLKKLLEKHRFVKQEKTVLKGLQKAYERAFVICQSIYDRKLFHPDNHEKLPDNLFQIIVILSKIIPLYELNQGFIPKLSEKDPKIQGLLIIPIQRVPRYKLLFTELMKSYQEEVPPSYVHQILVYTNIARDKEYLDKIEENIILHDLVLESKRVINIQFLKNEKNNLSSYWDLDEIETVLNVVYHYQLQIDIKEHELKQYLEKLNPTSEKNGGYYKEIYYLSKQMAEHFALHGKMLRMVFNELEYIKSTLKLEQFMVYQMIDKILGLKEVFIRRTKAINFKHRLSLIKDNFDMVLPKAPEMKKSASEGALNKKLK